MKRRVALLLTLAALFAVPGCGKTGTQRPSDTQRPAIRGSALDAIASGLLKADIPEMPELPRVSTERLPEAPPRTQAATPEEARRRTLADLRSGHPHHRYIAVHEAAAFGMQEAVPVLARLALSDEPAAIPSIVALGHIGGARAARALDRALSRRRNPAMDAAIVSALGRTRAAEAVRPLGRAMKDARLNIRLEAAAALGSLGVPEAVPPLRGLMNSTTAMPLERTVAAASLFLLGDEDALALLDRVSSEPDPVLQLVALRAMSSALNPAFAVGPAARSLATRSLGSALASQFDEVWSEAGHSLIALRPMEARPVVEALRSARPDVALRAELVLAAWRGRDSGGHVARAITWPHPMMRAFACRAAGELEPKEAVRHLGVAISDNHAGVRLAAVRALAEIGGEDARPALSRALASDDKALSLHAEQALERIGKKPLPADPGYRLEQIFLGADRRRFCVMRGPDGARTLLAEGDTLGPYTVRRIERDASGRGRVVMSRGETTVEYVLAPTGSKGGG